MTVITVGVPRHFGEDVFHIGKWIHALLLHLERTVVLPVPSRSRRENNYFSVSSLAHRRREIYTQQLRSIRVFCCSTAPMKQFATPDPLVFRTAVINYGCVNSVGLFASVQ